MDAQAIIHKTRQDYNRIARLFSNTRFDLWDELKPFKNLIKDGQNILDWGCGNGRLLFLLKDNDVKYFGVDQSDELLKIAQDKWQSEIKSGKAKFFNIADEEIRFEDNFFDLVFLIASFHHLPDEATRFELLNKIYKEMKSGSKIVITVWNLESAWAKDKLKKDWNKIGENDYIVPWKNSQGEKMAERYYHHFSEEELKNLLERANFKNIKLFFGDLGQKTDGRGGRNLIATAEK